ncbi:MAG: nuclear transport factor 2 family protein [Bdellovibrionaceae bacterium]|nr:nuclear transport factor 2 family protein [Pseudobdellovibrionaceae bacterium]
MEQEKTKAQPNQSSHALLDLEYDVRQKIEAFLKAVRHGQLDAITSFYSDKIVAYDMMPPLKFTDLKNYKESAWKQYFTDTFNFPIVYDYKEDSFKVFGDSALMYGEIHMIGTFKAGGEKTECRLRNTTFFQKLDGEWKIVHEHNSVPLDSNMKGLMNLKPSPEVSLSH